MITDLGDPRLLEEKPVPLNWMEMYWVLFALKLKMKDTNVADLKGVYGSVASKLDAAMRQYPTGIEPP